ncbi:MAG TPA: D-tyrosyl-tRNA(Tyr) deacylase [Thermodesulfobium narugense]|uniref:D-aminoacyl-tRNA deacylase n=1 Tax=Thermodesulfobium acidiphilum TaxID=1794699 RepID=A0A2R4W124_THEAF|nr:D-aminoacyl-tRNA deacylase [Thermodesulfobium acidiphilum]AWB10475.1 D-tyrosyl-tRNA(Tyr) deacylase [Thermodesulfobium acidiphilum]PMP86862.1 MAG: D-tyrosyl-tRNA(Tyr) deacylase [Thermodesulfobium narugense]HEM56340.1 D-tyrosyl-tRNA(Tyr) deacylase [Thermodesulfobium narugense]
MRVVAQRVLSASVSVSEKNLYSSISRGLTLLVNFEKDDKEEEVSLFCEKICKLRLFQSEKMPLDLSLLDIKGELLIVPQFTLLANTSKGLRPSFERSENPNRANELFEYMFNVLKEKVVVRKGFFGEHMKVSLVNDGPVTIIFDTKMNL